MKIILVLTIIYEALGNERQKEDGGIYCNYCKHEDFRIVCHRRRCRHRRRWIPIRRGARDQVSACTGIVRDI